MAFVTSKGTMDKETLAVRKYIAQRAELLGCLLYTSFTENILSVKQKHRRASCLIRENTLFSLRKTKQLIPLRIRQVDVYKRQLLYGAGGVPGRG